MVIHISIKLMCLWSHYPGAYSGGREGRDTILTRCTGPGISLVSSSMPEHHTSPPRGRTRPDQRSTDQQRQAPNETWWSPGVSLNSYTICLHHLPSRVVCVSLCVASVRRTRSDQPLSVTLTGSPHYGPYDDRFDMKRDYHRVRFCIDVCRSRTGRLGESTGCLGSMDSSHATMGAGKGLNVRVRPVEVGKTRDE